MDPRPTEQKPDKPTVVYTTTSSPAANEKENCTVCKKHVNDGVECEICERWFHAPCVSMTKATVKALADDKSLHWFCEGCKSGVVTMWKKIKERQDELEEKMRSVVKEVEGLRKETNTKQSKMEHEISIMKKEMKGMKEAFEDVKKVNSGNEEKIGDALEAKWVTVKEEVSGLESRLTTKFVEIKKDVETLEIEKRRTNIIFHGVKESDDVAHDVDKVREILSKGLHIDCERHLGEMYRIGMKKDDKVRPIRLVVKTLEGKIEIIKRAKQLKDSEEFKKIFVSPDLTRKQQLEDKELRDKLKSFRQDDHSGARIIIKGGKIIMEKEDGQRNVLFDPKKSRKGPRH